MNFCLSNWFKGILTSVLLIFIISESFAIDPLRISLADIIQKAQQHSRHIEQAYLQVKQSDVAVQQQRMELLPKVSIRGSASYASNMPIYDNGLFHKPSQHDVIHYLYDTGADFYLNLYNGHRDLMEIQSSKLESEMARIDWLATSAKIKMDVCNLFLDLLLLHSNQEMIADDISDQREQLKEVNHLYQAGIVLHSDVLRIELELSKRELLQVEIENDIQATNQRLQLITGIKEHILPIAPALEAKVLDYDTLLSIAKKQAFTLLKSEQEVSLKKLQVKQAKANYLPEVGLTGTFTFANPQIFLYPYNDSWYNLGIVGLKLNIPVSAIYMNKHVVRGAHIALEKEEVKHHFEEENIQNQLLQAYLDYQLAIKQQEICQNNVLLAKENARIIKNRYFKSSALVTDLLDADMQQLKTLFELESAKVTIQKHYYFIEFLKGTI